MKKLIVFIAFSFVSIGAMDKERTEATQNLFELIREMRDLDYEREKLQTLLDKGADVNGKDKYTGRTPLESAALFNRSIIFDFLVMQGATVTPSTLVWAVEGEHGSMVEKLIEQYKIDVNSNAGGYSALQCAVRSGNQGLVLLLFMKGAVASPSDYGWRSEMDRLLKAETKKSKLENK